MKNIYITIGILVAIILGLFLVYNAGKKNGLDQEKNNQVEERLKPIIVKQEITQKQIDSILSVNKNIEKEKDGLKVKEVRVTEYINSIKIEKPKDSACNDLYSKATTKINLLNDKILLKDSIEKKSEIIIQNQYQMLSRKDSIIFYKEEQISLIKNKKQIKKRFGVGANVGYGAVVNGDRINLKPYLGLGVTYTFFNF